MAEVRGDEWLPEGWKVEVRVRKSGRKDRYYTDPASGYVFRSLKDIDRYLLTGKLGKHVVKSKTNDVPGGSDLMIDWEEAPANVLVEDASKEKNSNLSNGSEKSLLGVQKRKQAKNGKKKAVSGGKKSTDKSKDRKISKSPQKKGSDNFFILDPNEGVEGTNELGLSNFPEIIDSVRKCEDNRNAMYLSAPEIAALLGRQAPLEDATNQDHYEHPTLQEAPLAALNATVAGADGSLPFWSSLPTNLEGVSQGQGNQNVPVETEAVLDQKWDLDSPVALSFGDMCSDPCIEFAIKTLTGAIPLGSASDVADADGLRPLGSEQLIGAMKAPKEESDHTRGPEQSNQCGM